MRADLLSKMDRIDAGAATDEERSQGGVTKLRYSSYRDGLTSTPELGFRIDAAHIVSRGAVSPLEADFARLRDEARVLGVLAAFLQRHAPLCRAVRTKLEHIEASLERSSFFPRCLLLRSSLLLVYDGASLGTEPDVELKMIDFASSETLPDGAVADHTAAWDGTKESLSDGYLMGVKALLRLVKQVEAGEDSPLPLQAQHPLQA